jgi:hypothetical protein
MPPRTRSLARDFSDALNFELYRQVHRFAVQMKFQSVTTREGKLTNISVPPAKGISSVGLPIRSPAI